MKNKFAVVILNWNGQALLKKFLPSVVKYSSNATIYVIDNASTDASLSLLTEDFPQVNIIQNKGNYGFAQGYNEGLKLIKEPYLALINSDIEVTENWLSPIEKLFETEANTAIIQPKILDYKSKDHFEYAGAAGGFLDKYGFPYCRGRIFTTIEEDHGQYNDEVAIFWASGASFFIRNTVYQELKGFDEDFFAHQEEIDLCWRAHSLGYDIKYCGFSTVYHVGGATLGYQQPHKTYLNFRNSLLMLYKNLPQKGKFSIIFTRLCLDGIAGIRFFLMGQPKHCFAIIRAHFGFYRRLSHFKNKRTKNSYNNYYNIKSIAFNYFLQKKEKYTANY